MHSPEYLLVNVDFLVQRKFFIINKINKISRIEYSKRDIEIEKKVGKAKKILFKMFQISKIPRPYRANFN